MINQVVLVGRLVADLDLRYTQAGKAVASGRIAVNRPFKSQSGDQEADFISLNIWGRSAENAANFTKKGSLIGITGRINTRNYENSEGKRVFVTEVSADNIQFLEPKGSNQQQEQQREHKPQENKQPDVSKDPFSNDGQPIDISDDDLPF